MVNGYGVSDRAVAVRAATDAEVDRVIEAYCDDYDVVPELVPGGDRHDGLREAARIEVGLRSILEPGGFGAFTDTFEDLHPLLQLPGIAVQRLMAEGSGSGDRRRADGPRRPVPDRGQRDRRRRAAARAAAPPGRARRVEASAGRPDGAGGLALRGRRAPHRADQRDRDRALAGPRGDGGD